MAVTTGAGGKSSTKNPGADEKTVTGAIASSDDATSDCGFEVHAEIEGPVCRGAAPLVRVAGDADGVIADPFNPQPEVRLDGIQHVVDFTHLEYPADSHVG